MKSLLHVVLAACLLSVSATASAEGVHIGYCDGNIYSDMVTGQNGQAEVSAAVKITGEMLSPYSSCRITSLYVGLSESATQFPETVTGWLRNELSGDNLLSAQVQAHGGWLTVTFDEPLPVSDYVETGIYAGFSYQQESKLVVLSAGGPTGIPDACWIAKNDKWSNMNSRGVLPIEVVVEGDDLTQHDLSITDVVLPHYGIVRQDEDIRFRATISNLAQITADQPVLQYAATDGSISGQMVLPLSLAYRESETIELSIPTAELALDAEATIDLQLLWADGSTDEEPADNLARVTVSLVGQTMLRQMVVEEGTGDWCGFCPRGIVGMREMKALYPDRFIGISIHDDDLYQVDAYDQWIRAYHFTTFPNCIINRDGWNYDPEFSLLQEHLLRLDTVAEAQVKLVKAVVEEGQLTVQTEVEFCRSLSEAHYNMVFLVLEDQLPIVQSNYYSGGGYGKMGGFESLGSHCHIEVDDVVRSVAPSPEGASGLIPSSVVKYQPMEVTYQTEMPDYADPTQLCVVALLVNADNGEITNAAYSRQIEGLIDAAISTVNMDALQGGMRFDLLGRQVKGTPQNKCIIITHN